MFLHEVTEVEREGVQSLFTSVCIASKHTTRNRLQGEIKPGFCSMEAVNRGAITTTHSDQGITQKKSAPGSPVVAVPPYPK